MTSDIQLRDVVEGDLPAFFRFHVDPASCHMAAFIVKDPDDPEAFRAHWARILADDDIVKRTIELDGDTVGYLVAFDRLGDREVGFWIDRAHWGKGIATDAVRRFVDLIRIRPLHARAARDNLGSLRVLEKCGFVVASYERAFANARREEIEEAVLVLAEATE